MSGRVTGRDIRAIDRTFRVLDEHFASLTCGHGRFRPQTSIYLQALVDIATEGFRQIYRGHGEAFFDHMQIRISLPCSKNANRTRCAGLFESRLFGFPRRGVKTQPCLLGAR